MNGIDQHTMKMGMMNYIRTGNPILDGVIMSLFGMILYKVIELLNFDKLQQLLVNVKDFFFPPTPPDIYNEVIITDKQYLTKSGEVIADGSDTYYVYNKHLFEAFYYYFNENVKHLKKNELSINFGSHAYSDLVYRDFRFNFRPSEEIKIGDFIISYQIKDSKNQDKKSESKEKKDDPKKITNNVEEFLKKQIIKTLKIKSLLSVMEIEKFIKEIWTKYVDCKYPLVKRDPTKIIYHYNIRKKTPEGKIFYERYQLNTKISFGDIFFDGKEKLIKRLYDFRNGQTKWSSFKILLHGKPGGGKTSFIKALQNELGLEIFPIKLSQFDNIDELIDTFHKPIISNINSMQWDCPIKNRCYLLEDIDAESDIVLKRDSDSDSDSDSESAKSEQKSKQKKSKGKIKKYEKSHWGSRFRYYESDSDEDDHPYSQHKKNYKKEQKLKLADILNLLDGVLELNGCFIVMTTNYLEKLDDALVRDGRITYKLELGEININNMKLMINNFIPDYDPKSFNPKLQNLLEKMPPVMPCTFERLVKNDDNLDDIMQNIHKFISNN